MIPFGRYDVHGEIASGGMASVCFGTVRGDHGFRRVVAVKTMHPSLAGDPRFVAMFRDEALLASRVRHPNVVSVLDVVSHGDEVAIVMEYVRGVPLSTLLARAAASNEEVPLAVAVAIVVGVLSGLHAAHEARGADGTPLDLVHRDVSPQNVLVDGDGVARVVDFGIAKASAQLHVTQEGEVKGKLAFMAPEQIRSGVVDRRADVYAAGVVFYSMVLGRPLFGKGEVDEVMREVLERPVPSLRTVRPDVSQSLADVIARAIDRDPAARFPTARELAIAIEDAFDRPASARQVGAWVERLGQTFLASCDREVSRIEGRTTDDDAPAWAPSESPLEVTGTDAPTVELPPAALPPTPGLVAAIDGAPSSIATSTSQTIASPSATPTHDAAQGARDAPFRTSAPRTARTVVALVGTLLLTGSVVVFAFWLPGDDEHPRLKHVATVNPTPVDEVPAVGPSATPAASAAAPVASAAASAPAVRARSLRPGEYYPSRP